MRPTAVDLVLAAPYPLFMTSQSLKSSQLRQAYDSTADGWQSNIEKLGYPEAYRSLFAAYPTPENAHILDVGTGTGAFAEACLSQSPAGSLTLVDLSEPMLAQAKARLGEYCPVETFASGIGDAEPKAQYDAVLAAHVLEHIDDPAARLTWLFERTKPGGAIYLSVSRPHWCTAIVWWRWRHKAFRPKNMLKLIETAGFVDAKAFAFPSGPPSRTSMGYVARRP